jgi:hypothetical protein
MPLPIVEPLSLVGRLLGKSGIFGGEGIVGVKS